jgi:hypothetical protein
MPSMGWKQNSRSVGGGGFFGQSCCMDHLFWLGYTSIEYKGTLCLPVGAEGALVIPVNTEGVPMYWDRIILMNQLEYA